MESKVSHITLPFWEVLMNILVTSVGTATSVNLIKYFRRGKHKVVGTDINEYGYTAGSLLVDCYYQISLAHEESFIFEIIEIIKREDIDVLIPVNDVEVYMISEHKRDILCTTLVPDAKTITEIRDKYVCSQRMTQLGIPVPRIISSTDTSCKKILRDRIGVGSRGILVIDRNESVPEYDISDKFLQEYIAGNEYTIDVLANRKGKPVYVVPRKRLEVKSGVATKVKIVKEEKLISYAKMILDYYVLPGFSNIQFIKDENERFWFLEINCRFSGCGAATLATSSNYLCCFEKIVMNEPVSYKLNADTRWNSIVTRYYEEVVYENSIH